jgi:methylated-DNA-[protein]-cysteine S-methyltransferase
MPTMRTVAPTIWTTLDTPVGELRVSAAADAVTAVDFLGDPPEGQDASRSAAVHAARARGRPLGERDDVDPLLRDAVAQLEAYFAGELRTFDLPLDPYGSPFQLRVWDQLRTIGYGEVVTYGALATRLGLSGRGARAVGLANGRNPIPVVVPCHRVVGANGALTGYGGGLARKKLLLDLGPTPCSEVPRAVTNVPLSWADPSPTSRCRGPSRHKCPAG